MKKGDLILLILLSLSVILSLGLFFLKPKALNCVVYENGVKVASYPMNEDFEINVSTKGGHYNTLTIKDGKAAITSADCANQICVHTAPIDQTGDVIICLPHKLSVVLESGKQN